MSGLEPSEFHSPRFIDNRDGNTMLQALAQVLGNKATGMAAGDSPRPDDIAIASAFFSPSGLSAIAAHLDGVNRVRLLFGVEAPPDLEMLRPKLGESPEQFRIRLLRERLKASESAAREARDRFPYTAQGIQALRSLIARLRNQNVEVRRYERGFLHAKAYIFIPPKGVIGGKAGVIAGSSNLTRSGLDRNLELNLGHYDDPVVAEARQWFDSLWDEAEPVDLAAVYAEMFAPFTPWEIFLRILFRLYGDEVAELQNDDKGLPLTSFQAHGVARALRLIDECGGVLVADEVGLGKTFIAGEVIRRYYRSRQRALLICPAQLRDTTWKKFLARWRLELSVECLSFDELANDVQLADAQRPNARAHHLERPLDEYQLIVVDEAHSYRNPDTATRAAVLRRLLFGRPRDVLLLTATPVNNSLWDLFHLIRFFVRQDAFLANRGVLSIYQRFHEAMRQDPANLSPDLLYPIIDATCVKRTRQFVKKHYSNDTIVGPDGREHVIVFPQPKAITVRYALDDPLPALFDDIEGALDPDRDAAIQFARYNPEQFLNAGRDQEDDARAAASIGLIRSGLLKRFESSCFAFHRTLEKLIGGHEVFLEALDKGHIVSTQFLNEFSGDDSDLEEMLASSGDKVPATLFRAKDLKAAVQSDLAKLRGLSRNVAEMRPAHDPKLKALVSELEKIAAEASSDATDAIDEAQKRKVLLFSFFADTVEYVRKFLLEEVRRNPALASYGQRVIAVTGGDDLENVSRQQAIYGFAPVSTESQSGDDLYDILITTDVLAEGVNLQQCRNIINLDVPWNPMRLVQRHGRIDRIGSPHPRVFLRTIFPADRLNDLLNLEQRILAKIAMAAASIGVNAPVDGAVHGAQVFTETREEIEKLLRENPELYERGGTAAAAQSGEEYRQTLRKALDENRSRVANLPWKASSGMAKGNERGILFCASVGDRTYLRFVRATDDWQPRDGQDSILSEIGTCLRIAECEPATIREYPRQLESAVFDLWQVAQGDILRSWMIETDPANLQPKVRPLNLKVAGFIRDNPPAGMEAIQITQALDILESPWPRREEMMLRGWFVGGEREGAAKSAWLIEQILGTGLEPFREPEPLPPIRIDDIELYCWLAISPEIATAQD